MQCEMTWNPSGWPYVQRCRNEAVCRTNRVRDFYVEGLAVCEEHRLELQKELPSDNLTTTEGASVSPESEN